MRWRPCVISYKKMDFEELCAAAIGTYQLEALGTWNHIESTSFDYFQQESNWTVPVEEPGLWIHDFTLYGFVLCIPLIKAVGSNGNYKAIAEVCEQLQIVENRLKVKSLLDDVPMRRSSVDSTSGFQDDPQERWHIEFQP
ncbi:unnamed protein product [Lactuca virosa]|uniref:Uncharacterized protein n=1 Tax=Lactuca virosa TaxID=75947 RepID=A0AAU9P2K6_9ASTR|nr:unnamed protein product [Lactuca virosa]